MSIDRAMDDKIFPSLGLSISYSDMGQNILTEFVLPTLSRAVSYDRVTGYFTVHSLLAISQGIESLRRRKGHMRLLLGIHDVPEELAKASIDDDEYISDLVEDIKIRLFNEISTLVDELSKHRIAALAWMIQDGLLEVRVAVPKMVRDHAGIFHSKCLIFHDVSGNIVAAVGSPNETVSGLGDNFENLTVFMSWNDIPGYTKTHVLQFERMWEDLHPSLIVRPLEGEFAARLLASVGKDTKTPPEPVTSDSLVRSILHIAREMPQYSIVSGRSWALYPHQERAFLDALSRWPLRVMLADEVGLGKTFEAGAVINHAIRFYGVSKVTILVPKAVILQWQSEMKTHFGLDFWVYESSSKIFRSPDDDVVAISKGTVLSKKAPALTLISAQYARGTKGSKTIFDDAEEMPDLLVVDEAHAARVRPDISGNTKPTRMWRMLDKVSDRIPHLILMTATPMQTHLEEYHALLRLLGMPNRWKNNKSYEVSLRLVTDNDWTRQDALEAAELIKSTLEEMHPCPSILSAAEISLTEIIKSAGSAIERSAIVSEGRENAARLLVKLHPAHHLTIRNSRVALQAKGYRFPERNLTAPVLAIDDELGRLYGSVDRYLADAYFDVEKALHPDRRFNIGFVRCSYHQRLTSSLSACRLSLERRHARLSVLSSVEPTGQNDYDTDYDIEEDDDELALPTKDSLTGRLNDDVRGAVTREKQYIYDIMRLLDRVTGNSQDPKLSKMVDIVASHLAKKDKVLVFSRYTDTLDAAVGMFKSDHRLLGTSFAVYTGQRDRCWIEKDGGAEPAGRKAICLALETGDVRVVFCSDAASEGLNLQTARVLINLDVPWNPARLEQRIGRIARLGQKAPTIDIYNLWYPGSVESRIYTRLMSRKDLYDLAVGQYPEIVSQAIKDELKGRYVPLFATSGEDPIQTLNDLRNGLQMHALEKAWMSDIPERTVAEQFRIELVELLKSCFPYSTFEDGDSFDAGGEGLYVTTRPSFRGCISLGHPILDLLPNCNQAIGISCEIGVLEGDTGPVGFILKSGSGDFLMRQDALPALMAAASIGSPMSLEEHFMPIVMSDDECHLDGRIFDSMSWLPRVEKLTIPVYHSHGIRPVVNRSLRYRPIGRISMPT